MRLAPEQHEPDPWQLDLPDDPVAAAEYLRGIERARRNELESIIRLRQRIEGDRQDLRVSYRVAAAVAALVIVLATLALANLEGPLSDAPTPRDAHAGHGAMGSGLAVTLASDGASTSRDQAEPGRATFVLRNEASHPVMLVLGRTDATRAAAVSPMVAPGKRIEWSTTIETGTYELRSHAEGSAPKPGPTLTVG